MKNWKIIKAAGVERKIEFFKAEYPDRQNEVDRLLEEIQEYPVIRWATVFKDSGKFVVDRSQRLRFAGKAYPAERVIVLTHFSHHF
jgi:hypothetical protein